MAMIARRRPRRDRDDAGSALVVALLASMLLAALGQGLVLLTNTDHAIAANYHAGIDTAYAADGALARVLPELRRTPDWSPVLAGAVRSSFTDGTHSPVLPTGETIDLDQLTAILQSRSASEPWGANNSVWRLYAWGPVERLATTSRSRAYLAVWVADDPAEIDGNAGADTNRTIRVLAQAFGPNRSRRSIAATVGARESDRGEEFRPRIWSWREVR